MNREEGGSPAYCFLPVEQLEQLYQLLHQQGYRIHAPRVVDGAISYVESMSTDSLPKGVVDRQLPGSYRLQGSDQTGYFGWSSALQGVKSLLFPPEQPLWRSQQQADQTLQFEALSGDTDSVALFGVRACDLAAIALMDRHFLRPGAEDPWYRQRRTNLLLITVDCRSASDNCFCASTGAGPVAQQGFDLKLIELSSGYLVAAGSGRGELLLQSLELELELELELSESVHMAEALEQQAQVVAQQQRAVASSDFRPHFSTQLDSPVWKEIAERCLGCGNCTAVCPTCFCHREEEVASLDLQHSTHQRVWDSCFSDGHSQLHGISVRSGRRERYRQWMTHKLGGWHDQFGESGCVGCGRCITWCPVGIDLVKESARFVGEVVNE